MIVELKHIAPLNLIVDAIRQCYDSGHRSDSRYSTSFETPLRAETFILGAKDKELILKVIDHGHESTLEHCQITFQVKGFSRAVLQELARHRIGTSLSVKSTRFTLKELKNEAEFHGGTFEELKERAGKYLVFTENDLVDSNSIYALENLRLAIVNGVPNDYAKYCMPEAYKVEAIITMNFRSFRHFLGLRKPPVALWEIRDMANGMEEVVPDEYKFMLEGIGE